MNNVMKTSFLASILLLLSLTACEDDKEIVHPDRQSEVPAEFRGKWLRGNFSMTQFYSYTGQYLGNAFETSIAFDFRKDGHYEQFLVFQTQNYGCVLQSLSHFKGTVKFDEANHSFTVYPTEGKFRGYDNCGTHNFNRDAQKNELLTQTFYYSWSESGGTKYLEIRFDPSDENPSYFRAVTW